MALYIHNIWDDVYRYGNCAGRSSAAWVDTMMKVQLRDIFPGKTPLCIYQHNNGGPIQVSGFSGTYWCTYENDGAEWVEVEHVTHPRCAMLGSLINDWEAKKNELIQAKIQRSDALNQLEYQRHENIRLRQELEKVVSGKIIMDKCIRMAKYCLIALALGLVLGSLPGAESAKVSRKVIHQACLTTNTEWECRMFGKKQYSDLSWIPEYVGNKTNKIFRDQGIDPTYMFHYLKLATSWQVHTLLVVVMLLVKSVNPFSVLVPLMCAILSGTVHPVLFILGHSGNVGVFLSLAFSVIRAWAKPWVLWFVCLDFAVAICGSFIGTPGDVIVFKSCIVSILAMYMQITLESGVPSWVVCLALLIFKLVKLACNITADRIEFKEGTRTTSTYNLKDSVLSRALAFSQRFKQKIRTGCSPVVRIHPNSNVIIVTEDGYGSGFRVGNYVVTAKHVVSSNTNTLKIKWGDREEVTKVIKEVEDKDIALLKLPTAMQNLKAIKVAKNWVDGPVTIQTVGDNGVLEIAVAEGVKVRDLITYSVATANGTSGSPVLDPNGKLVGIHCQNTGWSGGAVAVSQDDFVVEKEKSEIELLREELARYKQGFETTDDIIALIREAVRQETDVLRHEVNRMMLTPEHPLYNRHYAYTHCGLFDEYDEDDYYQKKKGKNKPRKTGERRSRRPRKWFTEEEYKDIVERGLTSGQIKNLIAAKMNTYYDAAEADTGDGFPTWEDLGSDNDDELNGYWFGQAKEHLAKVEANEEKQSRWDQSPDGKLTNLVKQFTNDPVEIVDVEVSCAEIKPSPLNLSARMQPVLVCEKTNVGCYSLSPAEEKVIGPIISSSKTIIDTLLHNTTQAKGSKRVWKTGIDVDKLLHTIEDQWTTMEKEIIKAGYLPLCHRKKILPKNGLLPPVTGAQS
ncbi:MAG: ORF1a [Tasmanian devil-associated astrovirus 1]|nr:MAG: ORF1a [Tasmanian devil-associated astrovirus 1]